MRHFIILMGLWLLLSPSPAWAQSPDAVSLRLIHIAPGLEAVDIYIEDELRWSSIAPNGHTAYEQFAPGTYRIDIYNAGDPTPTGLRLSTQITLDVSRMTALLLPGDDQVILRLLSDDATGLAPNQAWLRFFNGLPQQPLRVTQADGSPRELAIYEVLNGVFPAQAQAITWQIGDEVFYTEPALELGALEEVLLVSSIASGQLEVLEIRQNLASTVRVLHAAPALDPVRVTLGDGPLAEALTYQSIVTQTRGYGTFPLQFTVGDDVLYAESTQLLPDYVYTWFVVSETQLFSLAEPRQLFADNVELIAGDIALFRLFHLAPNVPPVDIRSVEDVLLIDDLVFGAQPALLDVPAGEYNMLITLGDQSNEVLFNLSPTQLEGGRVYDVAIVGGVDDILTGQQRLVVDIRCFGATGC